MKKIKLAFDIGGNVGKHSDLLKGFCEKIICFEPNPELVNQLKIKFNNTNVVVDSRAVSNKNGKQVFYISSASTISTLSEDWVKNSRFSNFNWEDKKEIETITLEEAIKQYGVPEYVKIDVEGHEYEVLTNFNQLIDDCFFSFEWAEEQKYKIKATLEHLHELGYQKFGFRFGDELRFDSEVVWYNFFDFKLVDSLNEFSKSQWGMIYFKRK
jgi:FkbM family methyltransferase